MKTLRFLGDENMEMKIFTYIVLASKTKERKTVANAIPVVCRANDTEQAKQMATTILRGYITKNTFDQVSVEATEFDEAQLRQLLNGEIQALVSIDAIEDAFNAEILE